MLADEFQLKNFRWFLEDRRKLVLPQWQSDSILDWSYLVYRCYHFFTLVLTVSVLYFFSPREKTVSIFFRQLAYFTNWAYLVTFISSGLGVICVAKEYYKQKCRGDVTDENTPLLYTVYWIFFSMTTDLSTAVTLIYWTYKMYAWWSITILDIYHIWDGVFALMDVFVTAIPLRIFHVYASLILGLIYITFSIIYDQLGGTNPNGHRCLYPLINWHKRPGIAAASCIGALLGLMALRFLIYGLYCFRLWVYRKYYHDPNLT